MRVCVYLHKCLIVIETTTIKFVEATIILITTTAVNAIPFSINLTQVYEWAKSMNWFSFMVVVEQFCTGPLSLRTSKQSRGA